MYCHLKQTKVGVIYIISVCVLARKEDVALWTSSRPAYKLATHHCLCSIKRRLKLERQMQNFQWLFIPPLLPSPVIGADFTLRLRKQQRSKEMIQKPKRLLNVITSLYWELRGDAAPVLKHNNAPSYLSQILRLAKAKKKKKCRASRSDTSIRPCDTRRVAAFD